MSLVLAVTPTRRSLHTDCKANVTMLASGRQRATAGKRAVPRIWVSIFNSLDDDSPQAESVVWMPAHRSQAQIGIATKSNGMPITAVDWLANMAVDELAKSAAHSVRVPPQTLSKLDKAQRVATYWRAQLAEATFRSQNHVVSTTLQDGSVQTETRRDSDGKPAGNSKHGSARADSTDEEDDSAPPPPPSSTQPPPPPPPPPPQPVQATDASASAAIASSVYKATQDLLKAEQAKASRKAHEYPKEPTTVHPRNPTATRQRPRMPRQRTPPPAIQLRDPFTQTDISCHASVAHSLAFSAASTSEESNPRNDNGAGVYRWFWREEGGSEPPQEFGIHSDEDEAKATGFPDAQQPRTSRESFLQSLRRTVNNGIGVTAGTQSAATPVMSQPRAVAASATPRGIHRGLRRTSITHSSAGRRQGGSFASAAAPRALSDAMRRLIHQQPQGSSALGPAGASRMCEGA